MIKFPFLSYNGQEVQYDDFNRGWSFGGLSGDVALGELLRMGASSGTSPTRAILPSELKGVDNSLGTVAPGTGGVVVNAFTAIVGARLGGVLTDIRTSFFSGGTLALAAQSAGTGNVRLDLVYATIFVDQPGPFETRYIKNPTTLINTPLSLATTLVTSVTISVLSGTAATTPVVPTLPSDPTGGYNIPLAIVAVPNGFTSSSAVSQSTIMDISPSTGVGVNISPLNGAAVPAKMKSKFYVAPSSIGGRTLFGGIDVSSSQMGNGYILDNSSDWRKRIFKIDYQQAGAGNDFAWNTPATTSLPKANPSTAASLFANSFLLSSNPILVTMTDSGGSVSIAVDAITGALILGLTGSPALSAFLWITATAQLRNT